MSAGEFYDAVKTGGEWDYKNSPALRAGAGAGRYSYDLLQDFGNYHFGYVAHAFGLPLSTTLAGAGAYQVFVQGGGSDLRPENSSKSG